MKILMVLSALLVTNAFAEENRPPGCNDPVYACQDLSTARRCGVVTDCIHDIWSTLKAPNDNNEICDICKEMVKEARDQLLSNETQEEIKEVFEGSCELLYVKPIVDECKKVFDDLIPELIEMLASRMDPNMVCTVAGLCNNAALKDFSFKDKIHLLGFITSELKDSVCDGCKTLLSAAKHIATTIPQDQMQEILSHICEQFPTVAAQCNAMVTSYLPMAYNFLLTMDPSATCDSIGVCSVSGETGKPPANYGDDLTCEFCESLVQHLRDIILSNSTKEEFKTALLNMCSLMGDFSAECKELVNEYYDMLYDFIDENLDPDKVCTALGLCQSVGKNSIPMVRITPSENMWKGKHPNRKDIVPPMKTKKANPYNFLGVRVFPPKMVAKKNYEAKVTSNEIGDEPIQQLPIERMQHPLLTMTQDTDCAFSKAVMFFLEKDVKARNSKAITTALDNVCDAWLPVYKKECEHFINNNRKKIVELLVLGVHFDEVSGYLGLCHEEKVTAVKVVQPADVKNGISCDLCMQVMNYLKEELQDKKTEEEIREALDKVCTYLPQSLTKECEQFVNEYTDTIVALLLQEVDPSKICQAIGLCPGISNSAKNDFECDLCKEVMAYLKTVLSEPKVEDDIRKALDEVCSILPTSWATKCEQFVDQYTNLIITLLLEEVDPDNVCSMLGVCSGDGKHISMKAKETKLATVNPIKDSADCEICTTIMGYLENELKDQTVESGIRTALDEVCSILPQSYAVKCQEFVDKHTETVIKLLVQNISPSMVCSLLKECQSQNIPCVLCEYALHFLQNELMNNSTEVTVKALAEKLCPYLPKDIATECNAFIEEYGDAIIVLLAQQLDPSIICPLFKVCPSKGLPRELPAAPIKVIKQDHCDICKAIVNYIDKLLEEDDIDKELTDLAAKVCSILPSSSQGECSSIVHIYGPYILHMIGKLDDAQQLCQSIDICPRTTGHAHLLGAEKCTFGPSYWCQSRAHAAACKAETYCNQKVWKN